MQEGLKAGAGTGGGRPKSSYIPTLDGWRAIAILWVILSHNQLHRFGILSNYWFRQTGYAGVQLFFALSGILICGRLLREEAEHGSISLRGFYLRRLFRIQPAALLYLTVVALLALNNGTAIVWKGIAAAALMVRNIWPYGDNAQSWTTVHFWSLAVEEHFYFLLPGFLLVCRRHRLLILSVLVVLLAIWRVHVLGTPGLQTFGGSVFLRTDLTIGTILLGSVAALALERPGILVLAKRFLLPWVALAFTAAVCVRLCTHHSRFDYALLSTVYPLLIGSTMLHPATILSRVLELAPVRFVGRLSYSLYLWQQLFFYPFAPPVPHTFRSHALLCWAATFACALGSYYLVETPLIRKGHVLAKRYAAAARPREELATS